MVWSLRCNIAKTGGGAHGRKIAGHGGIDRRATAPTKQQSRIKNQESRIKNRESRIENRESRIENRELRIEN